jgi:hypothetical protein
MDMRALLLALIVGVLYPIWLIAGGLDYLCHRRTRIELTSGSKESWMHVAQFGCIVIVMTLAVLLETSAAVWVLMLCFVLLHSVFVYADVSYTNGLREISALEQQVHGYMEVMPIVAVCLVGIMDWSQIRASSGFALRTDGPGTIGWSLLVSLLMLGGVPILAELLRALRAERSPVFEQRGELS